ncbi:hypothetical protein SRABI106_04554 [Rahnella aquatilis]|nr:hypothetical protein SRABI106_04554 [Rahnella aquatilis]
MTVEISALAGFEHVGPQLEIFQFMFRTLGKQFVSNTYRQLIFLMKLIDDLIILRVILEAAACINRAGEAETVQFTHKLAGRVHLLFQRQFRSFRQR